MTLELLQGEMIGAMKNKDKLRKDVLSSLIGAVKKAAIDERCKDNISEELVNKVLLKEKKTMQEMIDTCPADRVDTLTEYHDKMTIIDEFTPKMMTEEEIRGEIIRFLDSNKAITKGELMKRLAQKLKGKADMKVVSKIVGEFV